MLQEKEQSHEFVHAAELTEMIMLSQRRISEVWISAA